MKRHITFIHGISNKPESDELLKIWKNALKFNNGVDLEELGITSSMVYWADIYHESPLIDQVKEESYGESYGNVLTKDAIDFSWRKRLSDEENKYLESLEKKLGVKLEEEILDENGKILSDNLERIPLPWFIKKAVMKSLLVEVHHYLFNNKTEPRKGEHYQVQDEIRTRFINELNKHTEKDIHLVISHSMGTVISYDCIRNVEDCPAIDNYMTIGSPLGIDEVQDKIKPIDKKKVDYPGKVLGKWINIYDPIDAVSFLDKKISNDYKKDGKKVIEDIKVKNPGTWTHSMTKYLERKDLRLKVLELLKIDESEID